MAAVSKLTAPVRLSFWALLLCLLSVVGVVHAEPLQSIPPLSARVVDSTSTLSADQRRVLEDKLRELEAEKGAQLAVLVVPSVQPESLEQYSLRVAEAWKLGRKGIDDGAILLVVMRDRKVRIEVGYGLEGALTDAITQRIIREAITPAFQQGDYAGGIAAGVDRMSSLVRGEALPAAKGTRAAAPKQGSRLVGSLFGLFIAGAVLRAMFGRILGAMALGALAAAVGWFILSSVVLAALMGVVGFFVTLLGGLGVGGGYGGGYGGGGGWSSGGGGGFSGGGGSFGGGGSSGSW